MRKKEAEEFVIGGSLGGELLRLWWFSEKEKQEILERKELLSIDVNHVFILSLSFAFPISISLSFRILVAVYVGCISLALVVVCLQFSFGWCKA